MDAIIACQVPQSCLKPRSNAKRAKASPVPSLYPIAVSNTKPKFSYKRDVLSNVFSIHTKNPHIIHREIQRLASQKKLNEALEILDFLDHRGIPVNVTTFTSLITACVRLKSIDFARRVHAYIRVNGLERNEFLQTKLVQLYACCGSIDDAKGVFETMPVTSVYPWNALLRGNIMMGRCSHREILTSFSEMQLSGVDLNVYSFSSLIKSLGANHSLRQGMKTHGIMIKNGFFESSVLKTSLIDMYFKCGKIKLASAIFREIEEKDIVAWGAMIAGFAHNKLPREALRYTKLMVDDGIQVNSVILTIILPAIGEISALRTGKEVHAYITKKKGYSMQPFIHSSLIDMYCKCGDMISGRKVFYGSKQRSTVSWTALLSGYVQNGRLEQALRSIIWMQQEGFKPDLVTLATVLPVCGRLRALKQGKELHAYAVKNGFFPDVSISTCLMMMYSKCGSHSYCSKLFNTMEKKNVIAWTAMIECLIAGKRFHDALDVFRSMQTSKHRPDSVTVARSLSICSELKTLHLGKEIHAQVLKKNLESIPFVYTEVMRMYAKCGKIDKALSLFNTIPVKGSMAWTAIIEAHECNSQPEEAMNLFKQMLADGNGSSPTHFTLKAILNVCNAGGFADDAIRYFNLMTRKYRIRATQEHYSCIIQLLTRLGRKEEAENFAQLMRSSLPQV